MEAGEKQMSVDPYLEFLREILAAFKYNKSKTEELLQQIKDLNKTMKK